MKRLTFFAAIIASLWAPCTFFAKDNSSKHGLCVSVYFDIEKLKMDKEEKLRKLEMDIARNEHLIKEANQLLAEIKRAKSHGTEKERKDITVSEPFAQKALMSTKETPD
ncbi:MAG: hypothetical protein N2513_08285 [Deltaproteobacteria bacterium]|nr:hypothetical protein [Deltaproteobacteria bacterium]